MRTAFLSLLLIVAYSSNLNAQEYVLKVRKKEKESDYYPHISGVMDGDILLDVVCGNAITNNKNWRIISCVLTYGFKHVGNPIKIEGDKIPKYICDNWRSIDYRGLPIFITEIQAVDSNGELYHLNNLKFVLK